MEVFIRLFEESRLVRALTRFFALGGVLWAIVTFIDRIRESITPVFVHFTVSALALVIVIYSFNVLLNKLYGKLGTQNRIFRHPLHRYKQAVKRAMRLSAIDDSYFISLVWLKFSRIIFSMIIFSFLSLYLLINNHSHKWVENFMGIEIIVHEVLDYILAAGIVSSAIVIFWQLWEIDMISRGTAKLVNGRRNAMVYSRRRRRKRAGK